jgi:hypothetical protein
MSRHQARLYHAAGAAPARSTIAAATRDRDSKVFSGLFMDMLGMATRGLRRKMGDAARLTDSSLHLAGAGAQWARFSADVSLRQSTCRLRSRSGLPDLPHDHRGHGQRYRRRQNQPVEAGATSVFDLGYYDYARFLLSMLRKMAHDKQTLLERTRLVRTNLMHRKDFTRPKQLQKPPPLASQQLSLNWSST